MDQSTKDMAKRFYILLYLFLSRTYKNVEVVYIRHHTRAKEVDEHEFFYSQETGGTIVSSALKLMDEVVKERYNPAQWNIYAAQASDGDNWADDSPLCHEITAKKLLPVVRYYSYIEITRRAHQTLWREYEHLQSTFDNFAMQHIRDQMIFIRCSVNCFINKMQQLKTKTISRVIIARLILAYCKLSHLLHTLAYNRFKYDSITFT